MTLLFVLKVSIILMDNVHQPPCRGIFNAVNGKIFVLRGGAEHRSLKISQIVIVFFPSEREITLSQSEHYNYKENCSKKRAGGFNQLNVPNRLNCPPDQSFSSSSLVIGSARSSWKR